jgi:hypothetical protein
LKKVHADRAAPIILTMVHPASALYAVKGIRSRYPQVPLFARSRDEKHAIALREAGASDQASVKRHLPRLIEHIQAGRLEPKKVITHRIPLEEVADAYHIFSSKLDNCIKIVLIPPGA